MRHTADWRLPKELAWPSTEVGPAFGARPGEQGGEEEQEGGPRALQLAAGSWGVRAGPSPWKARGGEWLGRCVRALGVLASPDGCGYPGREDAARAREPPRSHIPSLCALPPRRCWWR